MVQRKVSNKLGIQAEPLKSEKRLVNLKPSSYQYQDGKNRGPDMKKKIKKSRSIKLSDIESLRSSPLQQTISQPGKPPPLNVPSMAATPQKQSPVKTTDGSPNYMKSTSSSEARKETSQVSSRYSQTGSDIKNQRRRNISNSKLGSGSSAKPSRTLTKSSSLKLIRTLTKAPSFKPVRASAKKCSRVVICADRNTQRATCSSTLKDSKFPDYLTLSPGATEAEGTSAVKVCPYTYCSLNGHHHTPLQPLKCFLSARRRLLKTQKSMTLEALSPRRVKPVGEGTEEIDAGHMMFHDHSGYKVSDLDHSPSSPLIKGGMDFFIEIYAKNKEGNSTSPFGGCGEAKIKHIYDKQIAESVSDGSPRSEIDFEENFEQDRGIVSIGVDITRCIPQEQKVEDPEKDYSSIAAQNEAVPESFYSGRDFEEDCSFSIERNDCISEASDMEWEEGQLSTSELDTAANYSTNIHKESDLNDGYLSEIKHHEFHDEPIIKSDNTAVGCTEEIAADEVFEEQGACFDPQPNNSDFEMEDAHRNLRIIESSQVSDSFSYDRQSSMEKACQEEQIVEPAASSEKIQETKIPEAEDEIPKMGPQLGDVKTCYDTKVTDGSLNDPQKEKSLQDDEVIMLLQNQIFDSFQNLDRTYQVAKDEGYNGSPESEDSEVDQTVAINVFEPETQLRERETGNQTEEKEQIAVTKRSIGVQVDIYPVAVSKVSVGVQAPGDLYEANQVDAKLDIDPCHIEDFAEAGMSSQDIVDEILQAENLEQPSEDDHDSMNVADNQKFVEKEEEKDEVNKFKIQSSTDSEAQSDSRTNKTNLDACSTGETEKMEVEDGIQSDIKETIPTTGSETDTELKSTSFLLENKSNQELPSTVSNQKWAIGSKRPINDEEELRGFNPREPNFLPVVPEPDAEKVDLRHQMQDERKTAEEWMVDYALQQTVTKLAPARKKKVALLVEAFETVMPIPKWKTHTRHSSAAFAPARPIQACS